MTTTATPNHPRAAAASPPASSPPRGRSADRCLRHDKPHRAGHRCPAKPVRGPRRVGIPRTRHHVGRRHRAVDIPPGRDGPRPPTRGSGWIPPSGAPPDTSRCRPTPSSSGSSIGPRGPARRPCRPTPRRSGSRPVDRVRFTPPRTATGNVPRTSSRPGGRTMLTTTRSVRLLAEGSTSARGHAGTTAGCGSRDFYDHAVRRSTSTGRCDGRRVDDQPSGLGWLPDGRLLVVSMLDRKLLRLEHDGAGRCTPTSPTSPRSTATTWSSTPRARLRRQLRLRPRRLSARATASKGVLADPGPPKHARPGRPRRHASRSPPRTCGSRTAR